MPNLVVPGFSGVVRILAPQRLEDHQATVALNCDFRTQDLLPMKGLGDVVSNLGAPGDNSSIYRYGNNIWLHYTKDVNFARTPYEDKLYGRLYVSGDNYPFVTDNTIIGSGGASPGRRYIGLPPPFTQRAVDGAYTYVDLPLPTADQAGTGKVASVVFVTGSSTATAPPAVVTCTAPHKLKSGTYVILDYPGIPSQSYQVALNGLESEPTKFRLRNLTIPSTKSAKFRRPGKNLPIQVIWSGHGLTTGDVVRFSGNVNWDSKTWVTANTDYFAVFFDANTITLQRINDSSDVTTDLNGDDTKRDPTFGAVRVRPADLEANYTVVNNGNKTFTVTYNPSTDNTYPNTWTTTSVAESLVDRSYLFTFVNGYGEEGPPSKPSETISVTPGTPVTIDLSAFKNLASSLNQPTGAYWITKLRIYRTDAMGTFRLLRTNQDATSATPVYEIAISSAMPGTFVDSSLDAVSAEPLSTEGWLPPTDDVNGITALPNGVMVGFRQSSITGKTVCASVPFFPYAWPLSYRINTESFIVGLAPTATGLVVLTDAMPYVITGTDPASWSAVKLEAQEPCLSKRSIVDMGEYAMYASPNGLIAINGAEVKNALANIMTREQWQDYNPSSITGSFYNGRYVGSYLSGPVRKTFVYEPATGNFIDVELDLRALWNDQKTGKLWALDPSGNLREWNAGGDMTYTWKSKLFTLPRPWNFASMQVLVEDYTKATTVQVYVSDAKIPLFQDGNGGALAKTLTDNAPFRLPSGYMSQAYQVELKGTGRVRAVGIATTVDELKEQP